MEKIYKFLEQSKKNNRLAHSYLAISSQVILKKDFIDGLSSILIETTDILLKKALDFERLVIMENDKQVIEIAEIRRVIDFAKFKPVFSQRRLVLIKNAHLLTLPAANNLLKIIEEPPPYLIFFLLSNRPELLPDTILSRCVILKKNTKEEKIAIEHNKKLFYDRLLKLDLGERFLLAESLIKKGKDEIPQFLNNWLMFLGESLDNKDELGLRRSINLIKLIKQTKSVLETTYVNPRLALERLFMNID